MKTAAIDFETYYDDEYTLFTMGPVNYCIDPRFDAYLVAIVTEDLQWVGDPRDAPWHKIDGMRWVAHNALFEECVVDRLKFDGKMPQDVNPSEWVDTIDLCFFFGLCGDKRTRALDKVSHTVYDITLDKGIRSNLKGKTSAELRFDLDEWEVVKNYCLMDTIPCLALWLDYGERWPEDEKEIARLTRLATKRGVPVNLDTLQAARKTLDEKRTECLNSMPWYPDRKPMSVAAFRDACEAEGLSLPKSTAKTDLDFQKFVAENKEDYPWITAISDLRRSNKMEKNMAKMEGHTDSLGRMHIGVCYHRAHTGRWSGEAVNLQGLNKEELFGINMRHVIEASPGKVFAILDYSQIEPRLLAWKVQDEQFLDLVRQGMSPYEAHARLAMGWKGGKLKEEDAGLYAFAKARVLGLGYGMGAERFHGECKKNFDFIRLGIKVSENEAQSTVKDYRESNWRITDFWKQLESVVRSMIGQKHGYLVLPSGRNLNYYRIREIPGMDKWGRMRDQLYISTWIGDPRGHGTWGGELTENYIQAAGRDVLVEAVLRVEKELGYVPEFTAHDEAVYEIPEEGAEATLKEIERLMSVAPEWATDLPLEMDSFLSPVYKK